MTLRWPDTLPLPQVESIGYGGPGYSEILDVLFGPTRVRLGNRNAIPSFEFEVWFAALEAEEFETWYNEVIAEHDGEWYAPWIGGGRVIAFADEYQMRPLGLGWSLTALVVQTRIDESLCDEHISEVFGALYRDDGVSPDIYRDDGVSPDIYKDDFPLDLIAEEPC